MDRTLLPVTPGRFQAGGKATEINHDPFAVPAVHAAPIDPAAKLFLRRPNRRQKNHRSLLDRRIFRRSLSASLIPACDIARVSGGNGG
jgi:hypothetical protein